jgi:uncharacterized C2H2 Zn-finger protein
MYWHGSQLYLVWQQSSGLVREIPGRFNKENIMELGCNHCNKKFKTRGAWTAHLAKCKGWLRASSIKKLVCSPKEKTVIKVAKPVHLIFILGTRSTTWCGKKLSYQNGNLTEMPRFATCKSCVKAYLGQKPFAKRRK